MLTLGGLGLGFARGEQHTELGLGQAGDLLFKMAQRRGGHGDGCGKRVRVAADAVELFQQHIGHAGLIDALHHHVDVRGGEDAVILGLEALRRHIDELAGVAAQLDARGGVAVEFAAGLPHAVETLRVELGLKAAGPGSRSRCARPRGRTRRPRDTGQRSCRTQCRRRRRSGSPPPARKRP